MKLYGSSVIKSLWVQAEIHGRFGDLFLFEVFFVFISIKLDFFAGMDLDKVYVIVFY